MYFPVSLYVFPLGIVYIHSGVIQKVLLYRSNIDVMKQNLNMLKMSEIKSLLKIYAFHIVYGNYNTVIWSTVSFNLRTMVPCYMWLVIKLINVSNAIPTLCGFLQISVYWCSYIWLIFWISITAWTPDYHWKCLNTFNIQRNWKEPWCNFISLLFLLSIKLLISEKYVFC